MALRPRQSLQNANQEGASAARDSSSVADALLRQMMTFKAEAELNTEIDQPQDGIKAMSFAVDSLFKEGILTEEAAQEMKSLLPTVGKMPQTQQQFFFNSLITGGTQE